MNSQRNGIAGLLIVAVTLASSGVSIGHSQAIIDTFYCVQEEFGSGKTNGTVKTDNDILWSNSVVVRGWGYFDTRERPSPIDSARLRYHQYYNDNAPDVYFIWVGGGNPLTLGAKPLFDTLVVGYSLGSEATANGWVVHRFPARVNWPSQMGDYLLISWTSSETTPPPTYAGAANGWQFTIPEHAPRLILYTHTP